MPVAVVVSCNCTQLFRFTRKSAGMNNSGARRVANGPAPRRRPRPRGCRGHAPAPTHSSVAAAAAHDRALPARKTAARFSSRGRLSAAPRGNRGGGGGPGVARPRRTDGAQQLCPRRRGARSQTRQRARPWLMFSHAAGTELGTPSA